MKSEIMDTDNSPPPNEEAGDVNLANAVDLSESEDEEEIEDLVDDFSMANLEREEVRHLKLIVPHSANIRLMGF